MGGRLTVTSMADNGTRVVAEIPWQTGDGTA